MAKMDVVKVTLSSKKVVYLRTMKISDTELAAQEVAQKANGDAAVLQILMQKALMKNLLLQVDDKRLGAADREDMDGLLTIYEYSQLLKVVQKMLGGDEMGKEPAIEAVDFGDK